eukprot:TRINITY_DN6089_c0_g1_i1.p1 TRINITY_DN6089_c0_g1~~TRINITY_DN6089_c0_g1_i1.p1  ORF type:complete len:367 (+),score=26.08 TRINITY_DN6089_c0_g1_i1:824-1924(+)
MKYSILLIIFLIICKQFSYTQQKQSSEDQPDFHKVDERPDQHSQNNKNSQQQSKHGLKHTSICEKSFVYSPAFVHSQTPEFLTKQFCNENEHTHKFCPLESSKLYKSVLYMNGSKDNQEFILCISPKAGITRMLQLLYKIEHQDYDGKMGSYLYRESLYHPLSRMHTEKVRNLLNNEQIPRFLLVRNPFVRAVSMFQEKIVKVKHMREEFFGSNRTEATFQNFVERLYAKKFDPYPDLDKHFISQSQFCKLPMGMSYNYILKMENINLWFDCFVKRVNVQDEVRTGWPGQDECFLPTPMHPCKGPKYRNDGSIEQAGQAMQSGSMRKHMTNSSNSLSVHYANKTLMEMVAKVFEDDIVNFNYAVPN